MEGTGHSLGSGGGCRPVQGSRDQGMKEVTGIKRPRNEGGLGVAGSTMRASVCMARPASSSMHAATVCAVQEPQRKGGILEPRIGSEQAETHAVSIV